MSTFKGIVAEFPEIRIDYFRSSDDAGTTPPLACFLSHVHTDHLQGLEGFYGGPFIHCSAATKELLVRLQRRVHRLNWQTGIVESQDCHYKAVGKKLKAIPLETPTIVELGLGSKIRVTLFDANHCVGAVMFLIEGGGKAILYTGDIRAEPWWVEYIARHPVMVPYTTGVKTLDNIYLDTTHAESNCVHSSYPSKRDGLRELLQRLLKYPNDAIFHFNPWTFGFEEVWVALSAALESQIHVGKYHYKLYQTVRQQEKYTYGPFLGGYEFGNSSVPGVLTQDSGVRIHSCERGLDCEGLQGKNVVYLKPIVTRVGDLDISEEAALGGDLANQDDLILSGDQMAMLLFALETHLNAQLPLEIKSMLIRARNSRRQAIQLPFKDDVGNVDLTTLLKMLSEKAKREEMRRVEQRPPVASEPDAVKSETGGDLPKMVTFPYARHSSYMELRGLVAAFRPRDIYACTTAEDWTEEHSMEYLFGDLCTASTFSHDRELRQMRLEELERERARYEDEDRLRMSSQQRLTRSHYEESMISLDNACCADEETKGRGGTARSLKASQEQNSSPPPFDGRVLPHQETHMTAADNQLLSDMGRQDFSLLEGSSTASSSLAASPVKPKWDSFKRSAEPWNSSPLAQGLSDKRLKLSKEDEATKLSSKKETHHKWSAQTLVPPSTSESASKTLTRPARSATELLSPEPTPNVRLGPQRSMHRDSPPLSPRGHPAQFTSASESSDSELLDDEEVEKAKHAAMGLGSASWWDIQLESTKQTWSYQEAYEKDIEL